MFRARVSAEPQQLQPYLDLANFYFSDRRYDDFDQTLKAALKLIRQAEARAGADGTVPKPAKLSRAGSARMSPRPSGCVKSNPTIRRTWSSVAAGAP